MTVSKISRDRACSTRWVVEKCFAIAGFALLLGPSATSIRASAQTVADVYNFTANGSSQDPGFVTPAQGRDGSLFGTTSGAGGDYGSVFRVTTSGFEAELHAFNQGGNPSVGLTLAADGNFYGATEGGGTSNKGVLFRISANGLYTVLHNFAGGADGTFPRGTPMVASDGNIYGTTEGTLSADSGATIYRYTPAGTFSTIYQFDENTAIIAPLIQGTDGSLYGTAAASGPNFCGSIFKISRAGVILMSYSFPCGAGGSAPSGPLLQAADGNFYGTAEQGGTLANGIVFRMTPKGRVSILYNFRGGSDGAVPDAGFVQGTDGMLYGTTSGGGSAGFGTLYQISTTGLYKSLYTFTGVTGEFPFAALLQHTNGKFYGTAQQGGTHGFGSVYSLDMGLGPFVTFLQPTGRIGKTVQILGQGLTGTTGVTFNTLPATSFTVASDTSMAAVIPSGATTGPVVVTTPGGTLTSNVSFRIIP